MVAAIFDTDMAIQFLIRYFVTLDRATCKKGSRHIAYFFSSYPAHKANRKYFQVLGLLCHKGHKAICDR